MQDLGSHPDVLEHARMWLPILVWALGGAGTIIVGLAVIVWRLYRRCQLAENIDLHKAILNQSKLLGSAIDRFNERFELGKVEFARQRKVLRTHMIFILAICESVKLKLNLKEGDLDCGEVIDTLKELDNYSERL